MEKIINFWLISTICAAVLYVASLFCDWSDVFFGVSCFTAGVYLVVSCIVAPNSSDVESAISQWNSLFSIAVVITTVAVEYGVVYKLAESPLGFSIPVALVCGIFAVYFLQNFRKGLLSKL